MPRLREESLSTHVLDTERGAPAPGVPVTLFRWDADRLLRIGSSETDQDGRIEDLDGGDWRTGTYRIAFDVATYYHRTGRDAPFLQTVTVDFHVLDASRHYHVPLLLAPFGCTTYRGS